MLRYTFLPSLPFKGSHLSTTPSSCSSKSALSWDSAMSPSHFNSHSLFCFLDGSGKRFSSSWEVGRHKFSTLARGNLHCSEYTMEHQPNILKSIHHIWTWTWSSWSCRRCHSTCIACWSSYAEGNGFCLPHYPW